MKLNIAGLTRKIEQRRKAIAKQRDALRELISEAEQLEECASDAHDGLGEAVRSLESAKDDLSKFA